MFVVKFNYENQKCVFIKIPLNDDLFSTLNYICNRYHNWFWLQNTLPFMQIEQWKEEQENTWICVVSWWHPEEAIKWKGLWDICVFFCSSLCCSSCNFFNMNSTHCLSFTHVLILGAWNLGVSSYCNSVYNKKNIL